MFDFGIEFLVTTCHAFLFQFNINKNMFLKILAFFIFKVLTKTYKLSCEIDKDLPFAFEGPEISSTFG